MVGSAMLLSTSAPHTSITRGVTEGQAPAAGCTCGGGTAGAGAHAVSIAGDLTTP
jgi:hypothetical protein